MTQRQPARPYAPGMNWLLQPNPLRDNLLAGAHGVGDSLPFGVADEVSAHVKAAILPRRPGENSRSAYARQMEAERAQDRYEAEHYRAMRTGGQIAGTIAQVAALGLGEGAILGGSRIAQAAGIIARERKALGAVGAAGGVVGQAVSDVAHRRLSSPGDYAGAAVGGTAEALASIYGRGSVAGAAGGAASAATRDLASGRLPSLEQASQAASQGALWDGGLGVAGRATSNALPWRGKRGDLTKGNLGESLSRVRTWARGDRTLPIGIKRKYLSKGWTYPDHWLANDKFVESKFGKSIDDLSDAQNRAFAELRERPHDPLYPKYRVDHWLPQDIGSALAFTFAPQRYLNPGEPWPPSAATD